MPTTLYTENFPHMSPVWTHIFPIEADHAEGSFIYASDGRKYLDFTCGIGVTIAYDAILSFALLFIIDKTMGLRVSPEAERASSDECHPQRSEHRVGLAARQLAALGIHQLDVRSNKVLIVALPARAPCPCLA